MEHQSISQKEIGKRLSQLRQLKGFSQEELAKMLDISRSSITQIELGNRKLNALELQRLSHLLSFSLDSFFLENFNVDSAIIEEKTMVQENAANYRVSKPTLNVEKFSNVLLYILERCAGKPNVGETLIYKLLYFADFNYYELYEEHLTGAKYFKLQYGPVPQNIGVLINKMLNDKILKRIKTDYHNYKQVRYIPLKKADLQELKASEKEVLDRVIEQFSDWSAKSISDYSHKDIPWLVSKDGEAIDYELALYREAPFSVRNYEEEL